MRYPPFAVLCLLVGNCDLHDLTAAGREAKAIVRHVERAILSKDHG